MMHWFHQRLKPIARAVVSALAMLWLVVGAVPCVMAQAQSMHQGCAPCPLLDGGMNTNAGDCGPVMVVSCQLPDFQSPLAAALGDLAITPMVLTVLPVVIAAPDNGMHPLHDFFSPDVPAPPLHIQYLTLIL